MTLKPFANRWRPIGTSLVILLSSIFFSNETFAQKQKRLDTSNVKRVGPEKISLVPLPDTVKVPITFNKLINASYATLIGGEGGTGTIGNYASVDPLNGGLVFKGSIAFGNPDEDNVSFLNIAAQGELINGNFATLFKDTKLNTTAGIQLEYSFRIVKNAGHIAVDGPLLAKINYDRDVVERQYQKDLAKLRASHSVKNLTDQINVLDSQRQFPSTQLNAYHIAIDSIKRLIAGQKPPFSTLQVLTEQLNKHQAEADKLDKLIKVNKTQIDSLNFLKSNSKLQAILDFKEQELLQAELDKLDKIESKIQLEEYSFTWLTVTAGAGKKDYYTYDKSQPFSMQLQNPNRNTFKLGLAINYFNYDRVTGGGWLFNGGLQRSRDNNIEKLTTQEIVQEVVFKNAAADTVRKATKKYQAYTDPSKIFNFQQWTVYGNLYHVFNGGDIALHLFPSFYKPDQKHGYVDAGLGLMFGFKDLKKEKSVINLEAFIVLSDAFDSLDNENRLVDRNQFGVRLTLPFNKLFK